MGRRINPRLTYSEYVSPDPEESTAVEMARWDLMDAIRRAYRPMLERLLADVFPAFRQLAKSGFEFDDMLWLPSPRTRIPEGPLRSALNKWAQYFNAKEGWFLDEVLRTLRGWYVAPDWQQSLRTNPIRAATATLPVGNKFHFTYEAWDPQLRPWEDYHRKAHGDFKKRLSEYEADCRRRAESFGLILAPRQYDLYILDSFVLYQFAGKSSLQVATSIKPATDESVVLRRVRAAARLLGWSQLRKVRRAHSSRHKPHKRR